MNKNNEKYSLLFLPPTIWPVFDHAIEIALKDLSKKNTNKLYIIFLDKAFRFNPSYSKYDFISRAESNLRYESIKNLLKKYNCEFINLKQFKKLEIKYSDFLSRLSLQCGLNSVQSQFKDTSIGLRGNKKHIIKKISKDFLSGYFFISLYSFDLDNLDRAIIFNGRFGFYRGVLEFCKHNKLKFNCFEYPFQGKKRYLLTKNAPIHDFNYRAKHLKKIADNYPIAFNTKINIGKNWIKKRNFERMGFEINFSKKQYDFKIPEAIQYAKNNKKKIILLLNSSEWEWSAFKESRTNIFDNQFNTFKWLVEDFLKENKDIFLVFRFHPQFAFRDLIYKEKVNLLLDKVNPNQIYIIQPESRVNTNSLSDYSDLILTFYTSAAPEASLLGKKVISIGPASFQYFKCCQMAKSKKSLIKKLLEESVLSKDKIKINKQNTYLFYFARCFQGVKPLFLKYDVNSRPFIIKEGKKIYLFRPLIIFYALRLFRIILFVLRNPKSIKLENFSRITKIFNLNF